MAKQQKPVSVLFFEKWDWGVKRFRITLIHDLTPHSPLVQPTTALSRVTVVVGGSVWCGKHMGRLLFLSREEKLDLKLEIIQMEQFKKKGKGAEPKTNLAVK